MQSELSTCAPSATFRLMWAIRSVPLRLRRTITSMLLRVIVWLAGDSNLIAHARRELPTDGDDDMQREMNRGLLQMLAVFSAQGHSGFSASYAASVLEKLLRFQPLGPLTGSDEEWFDHGGGMFQNKRCGRVFKQADRFNGQAYDLDGRVFREPSGACYTNRDSMVPITFPYTPKTEYVDVPASD
jgi:hypothetical protein